MTTYNFLLLAENNNNKTAKITLGKRLGCLPGQIEIKYKCLAKDEVNHNLEFVLEKLTELINQNVFNAVLLEPKLHLGEDIVSDLKLAAKFIYESDEQQPIPVFILEGNNLRQITYQLGKPLKGERREMDKIHASDYLNGEVKEIIHKYSKLKKIFLAQGKV